MSVGNVKVAAVTLTVAFIFSLSCSKLNNKHQDVKLECGSDANVGFQYFVKILDSQNRELTPETKSRLKIEALGANGSVPFRVSTKSCIMLQHQDVELSVSADNIQESGVEKYSFSDEIESLKLRAFPRINVRLNCPSNGYFAHDALKNVFDLSVDGDPKNFTLTLRVNEKGTPKYHDLFTKIKGQSLFVLPEYFETSGLPNGQYEIEVLYGNDFETWRNPRLLDTDNQRCPLTISHDSPGLKFLEANRSTVPPKSPILWTSDDGAEVKSCFVEDGEKFVTCGEEKICGEAKINSGLIESPDRAGNYRLMVWSEAKNGLKSQKICQNLRVATGAPDFSVKWRNRDWQDGFASFDLPYASIVADISRLDDGKKAAEFTCKVDFLSRGQVAIESPDAVCLSETCKGQAMNNFVPCRNEIEISMADVWKNRDIREAYLRLTVRADDGAQHIRDKSISSFLSEATFNLTDVETDKVDSSVNSDQPQYFYPMKNGDIFKQTENGDFVWNAQSGWKEAYQDGAKFTRIYVIRTSRGTVWSKTGTDTDKVFQLIQYVDRKWVPRLESSSPIQFSKEVSKDTMAVLADGKVYLISGDQLSFLTKLNNLPEDCGDFEYSVFVSNGNVFSICNRQVFESTTNGWIKRIENYRLGQNRCNSVDKDGNLICESYSKDEGRKFFVFDGKNGFEERDFSIYGREMYPSLLAREGVDGTLINGFDSKLGSGLFQMEKGTIYLDAESMPFFPKFALAYLERVEKVFGQDTYFMAGKRGRFRAVYMLKKHPQKLISLSFLASEPPDYMSFVESVTGNFLSRVHNEFARLENGVFKIYKNPLSSEQSRRLSFPSFTKELENGSIFVTDRKGTQFLWSRDSRDVKEVPIGVQIPGANYKDREGRFWFECNPAKGEFSFCMQDGENIKDVLAGRDSFVHFIDDGQVYFIITKGNKIFRDENRSGDFVEVDETWLTNGGFQLAQSKCQTFNNSELVCLQYVGRPYREEKVSIKGIWRWTNSSGMKESKISAPLVGTDLPTTQIDKLGRLIVRFVEGVYRLDGNQWTILFDQTDLQTRLKSKTVYFSEVFYEKVSDRLWYTDSEGHLWLEEHVSDRRQAPH